FDDFPIVLEAWRTCLQDEFDLDNLRRVLDELEQGRIAVREVTTSSPSPFASHMGWKRTNELMYEDDAPLGAPSRLRADLIHEVARSSHLRPRLAPELIERFRRKLQRTWPGYAPRSAAELLDWVVERVAIPWPEWEELLAAIARDHALEGDALLAELGSKVVATRQASGALRFVCARESVPRLAAALGFDPQARAFVPPPFDRALATSAAALAPSRPVEASPDEDPAGDPLVELVGELLRFHGPIRPGALADALGLDSAREGEAIEALAEADRVVVDELTDGAVGPEVCDAENLERLLRIARAEARPAFEALPAASLPLFLAAWQGLASGGAGIDDLRGALDRLFGLAAPASLWETDLLPARLDPYHPAWLDALLAEGELGWFGCGEQRLAFAIADDRALVMPPPAVDEKVPGAAPAPGAGDEAEGDDDGAAAVSTVQVGTPRAEDTAPESDELVLARLFPAGGGRFSFDELLARARIGSAELSRAVWRLVWRGAVSNDGFAAVRRGLESGFKAAEASPGPAAGRRSRRLGFERWKGTRPFAGNWFRLAATEPDGDALDREEDNRARARLVLDRYGVVFRELLERELPCLRWGPLFRTLRLMELSGEVVAGRFFDGVAGLQFASHAAVRTMRDGLAEDRVWWLNAADPASPCGLALGGGPAELPRRLPTSHLVFHGTRVVVVSERRGKALTVHAGPEHPRLPEYLGFLKVMLTRQARPMRAIVVETINGAAAASSPYRALLDAAFHTTRDGSTLRLTRRY
ncbi:MAG TPA: hypothetical protein VLW17_01100, partial [Thermoanaerobaculaceae bacterium]|nr:hypothetical protein [Thermoanaerobaculaceae bacterium]